MTASKGGRMYWLLTLVVFIKPISNYFLAAGLRYLPQLQSFHASLEAITNPLVALGISMQIYWLFSRMALLSHVDLSYILPITASGYTISALLGNVLLHEVVTPSHWAGILLITAGSALAGSTQCKTTSKPIITAVSNRISDSNLTS